MDRITIEPIDQTPTQFDLDNWLSERFPGAFAPPNWPDEPARLPVIEW